MEPRANINFRERLSLVLSRCGLLMVVVMVPFAWIGYNLVDKTVLHAPEWNRRAQASLGDTVMVNPRRGDILACDGTILATNVNTYDLRMDFRTGSLNEDTLRHYAPALADSMAAAFGTRTSKEWHRYLTAQLDKPKECRTRALTLLRGASYQDYLRLRTFPFFNQKNCNRSGLTRQTVVTRTYPYGDMARRSIGRTNHPDGVLRGYSGLEFALDSALRGVPGRAVRTPLTRGIVPVAQTPPVDGQSVTTTIDIGIQDIVEDQLAAILAQCKARWGTAVLMEVATGDIKAISNLERRSDRDSTYVEAANRAVIPVEPGSVIKLVGMIIALEDGFAPDLNRHFVTEHGGFPYKGGKPIRDTHFSPTSSLPVYSLLEYSSNIGMTKLVAPHFEDRPSRYRERVARLGFFQPFNTGIAGEVPPYYPRLEDDRGGCIGLSRCIYGYSTAVPPLYTCALYNAVANDGRFVRPRLVKAVTDAAGRTHQLPVTYVNPQMCSPQNAQTIRTMLRRVLTERGGTAKGLERHDGAPGVHIAGKTGTALLARERPRYTHEDSLAGRVSHEPFKPGYMEGHYRLAFVGMFPYEAPRYTCMVVVAEPAPGIRSAQYTAGATVRAIAEKMYSRGLLTPPGGGSGMPPVAAQTADSAGHRRQQSPRLYATADRQRVNTLRQGLGFDAYGTFRRPAATARGAVPDVRGLSVREALGRMEGAGYRARLGRGGDRVGYVTAQSAAPGTRLRRGSPVTLTLSNE